MSTSTLTIQRVRTHWLARLADYLELTKPKISVLVLLTVAVASFVAAWGQPSPLVLLHALVGTALVMASASSLNQWLECDCDARMERTADRPLPAGRLCRREVLALAITTIVAGLGYLALWVGWVTANWAALTWVLYVGLYTPLKSRTSWNTAVGAVAGAMPVMIGWSATGGTLDLRAATLLMIVFLWQFPHFMAIAWIYRRQYSKAGLKMLTVVDPSGRWAGVQAVVAALALLPISLLPAALGPAAAVYSVAALLLGTGQLICAVLFCARLDEKTARLLLRASLVYLPTLLTLLMLIPLL